MSALTAIFTTALLTSPNLGTLLETNASRLAEAYETTTSFFDKQNIEFIPVSYGPFVFAKIALHASTWEEEALAVACCKEAGVVVSSGRSYHIVESEKGWARLTFAIRREQLDEALVRLETGIRLFSERSSTDGHAT